MNLAIEIQRAAKKLSSSVMSWIPLLPNFSLTQRAMQLNHKLMLMYGKFLQDEGFVEFEDETRP